MIQTLKHNYPVFLAVAFILTFFLLIWGSQSLIAHRSPDRYENRPALFNGSFSPVMQDVGSNEIILSE